MLGALISHRMNPFEYGGPSIPPGYSSLDGTFLGASSHPSLFHFPLPKSTFGLSNLSLTPLTSHIPQKHVVYIDPSKIPLKDLINQVGIVPT